MGTKSFFGFKSICLGLSLFFLSALSNDKGQTWTSLDSLLRNQFSLSSFRVGTGSAQLLPQIGGVSSISKGRDIYFHGFNREEDQDMEKVYKYTCRP